jgi:hypothetical protein
MHHAQQMVCRRGAHDPARARARRSSYIVRTRRSASAEAAFTADTAASLLSSEPCEVKDSKVHSVTVQIAAPGHRTDTRAAVRSASEEDIAA